MNSFHQGQNHRPPCSPCTFMASELHPQNQPAAQERPGQLETAYQPWFQEACGADNRGKRAQGPEGPQWELRSTREDGEQCQPGLGVEESGAACPRWPV